MLIHCNRSTEHLLQPNISCGARLPGGNREDADAHVDWAIIVCKSDGHIVGALSFLCSEQHPALCSFWTVQFLASH